VLQDNVSNTAFVMKRFLGQCHKNSDNLLKSKPRSYVAYTVLNMVRIIVLPVHISSILSVENIYFNSNV
jgi:hypothetical protein